MKVLKNSLMVLCVLIMTAACAQNAFALPYSTFGSVNKWQGYKSYNQDGIDMTVMFNVYDNLTNPGEFTWNGAAVKPSADRYIYAYQIINNSNSQDISLFNLLDKSNNPLSQQVMHSSSSQSDGSALSIAPDPCPEQGKWEWSVSSGFLTAGKNSWYLIYSSDLAPVKGNFRVEAASQTEPPVPPVPEPCTLALFGIASTLFAAKRGRKRQAV